MASTDIQMWEQWISVLLKEIEYILYICTPNSRITASYYSISMFPKWFVIWYK